MQLSNPISIKSEMCSCFLFGDYQLHLLARIVYTLCAVMKAYLSGLKYILQQCYYKAIKT